MEKESIGQYTGFKDKNGKEIYEGDVIEIIDDEEADYYEVYYCKEMGIWGAYDEFAGIDDELYKILKYKNKVVGNIYEALKKIKIYDEELKEINK